VAHYFNTSAISPHNLFSLSVYIKAACILQPGKQVFNHLLQVDIGIAECDNQKLTLSKPETAVSIAKLATGHQKFYMVTTFWRSAKSSNRSSFQGNVG